MIYRKLALFALLIWKLPFFEQVTVNASGERLENNFVNPTYRGDQRVSIINTSSDNTKPVQVMQATHWLLVVVSGNSSMRSIRSHRYLWSNITSCKYHACMIFVIWDRGGPDSIRSLTSVVVWTKVMIAQSLQKTNWAQNLALHLSQPAWVYSEYSIRTLDVRCDAIALFMFVCRSQSGTCSWGN